LRSEEATPILGRRPSPVQGRPSMRPCLLTINALLLGTAAAAQAQDAVLLRLGGTVGQRIFSRMEMVTFMRGAAFDAMNVDTALPTMRVIAYVTQTLDSISGDTLWFSSAVDSARAESPASPRMGEILERALAHAQRRFAVRTDSRGRVIEMESDSAPALVPPLDPMPPSTPTGMGPGESGLVFPEHAVRVGESWSDSSLAPGQAGDQARHPRRSYRFDRIEPRGDSGTAVVTFAGSAPAPFGFEAGAVITAGAMRFDIAARRITALAVTSVYSGPSPMGPMTVRTEIRQAEAGEEAPIQPMIRRSASPAPPPRPPE